MGIKIRLVLIILGLVALLWSGMWLAPTIIHLYYQIRAGKELERIIASLGEPWEDLFACDIGPITDENAISELESAISDLHRSANYDRLAPLSHLLLGRAYCLKGEPARAVEHYQIFATRRPDNPLGFVELGVAYDVSASSQHTQGILFEDYESSQRETWRAAGVSVQDLLNRGLGSLRKGQYGEALKWNRRAWLLAGSRPDEINTGVCDQCVILESFLTGNWWSSCPWCDNVEGEFMIKGGVMEMGYRNRIDERDRYSFLSRPRIPIDEFSEFVIRLKGQPGTLFTLEMVVDGERTRSISYQPAPDNWQNLRYPIQGQILQEILVGIGEPGMLPATEEYRLWIDWIALQ